MMKHQYGFSFCAIVFAVLPVLAAGRPNPPTPGYVTATELHDGTAPLANANGNFIIGPIHNPAPEMTQDESVPHGKVLEFTIESTVSKIYRGIDRENDTFGTPDDSASAAQRNSSFQRHWSTFGMNTADA